MFKYLIKRTKDLVKEIHNEELALQKGLVPLVSRDIDEVIVHCTDSSVKKHDKFLKYFLYKWHVLERKWSDYGYHYAIKFNGEIVKLRPVKNMGAHCLNHNGRSIGVVLSGKREEDFTPEQFSSLRKLVHDINTIYPKTIGNVYPHSRFSNKTCPNFDLDQALFPQQPGSV